MSSIALKFAQHRAECVEDAVDQLQLDCEEADYACSVEQVVAEAADLLNPVRRVLAVFPDRFSATSGPKEIATAQVVAYLLNRVVALFPRVRDMIRDVLRRGYQVEGAGRFDNAESEIIAARSAFFSHWPLPDENRVRRAQEQLAAGQFRVL